MTEWLIFALLSAITAALVAIFGKVGLEGVDSITASGVRAGVMFITVVVLMLLTGRIKDVATLDRRSYSTSSSEGSRAPPPGSSTS